MREPGIAAPIIEKVHSESSFLPNHPVEIIESGHFKDVPIMLGFTADEGIVFLTVMNVYLNQKLITPDQAIPYYVNIKDDETRTNILNDIQDIYYKNASTENEGFINLVGDTWIYFDIYRTLVHQVKMSKSPVYLYRFSADTSMNFFKKLSSLTTDYPGTSHGDELGYMFTNFLTPKQIIGEVEKKTIELTVKLWTHFAKSGDLTTGYACNQNNCKVKPVREKKLNFVDVLNGELKVGVNPFRKTVEFWCKLYKLYHIKDYCSYFH